MRGSEQLSEARAADGSAPEGAERSDPCRRKGSRDHRDLRRGLHGQGGPARGVLGVTYLELIATAAIVMILASAILPLGKVTVTRQREIELRRALRELRTAIDRHKAAVDQGQIGGSDVKLGSEGYPPDLETLVKGVSRVGTTDRKLKFLRRIPVDPLAPDAEWGLRCYQDDPDATSWCGQNVYDVYSKNTGKALDGTKYTEW